MATEARYRHRPEGPGRGWSGLERRVFFGAFLAILAWGFIGVDRSILEELSGPVRIVQPKFLPANESEFGSFTNDSADLVSAGRQAFDANGCYACHTIDGSSKIGPSLQGLWGTEQRLQDGSSVLMDEAYFIESVLRPEARLVEGYDAAAMPSYEGLVSDRDLEALAAYVRSLH